MSQTKDPEGRLAENILYFARALRAAGIPLGPGSVLDALSAVRAAGVGGKEDFYWTLHAVFVKRHEHSVLFDQAFRIFFRKRGYLERLIAMMTPEMTGAPAQANEPQALAAVAVPEPVPEPVTVDGPLAEALVVTRPAVVPVVATSAAPAAFTPTARALTALWQRRDTRSLDRAFATLRRETLAFRSCALRVTENDRAVARCQGDVSWTIDFQRSRGSWSIAHVTTR